MHSVSMSSLRAPFLRRLANERVTARPPGRRSPVHLRHRERYLTRADKTPLSRLCNQPIVNEHQRSRLRPFPCWEPFFPHEPLATPKSRLLLARSEGRPDRRNGTALRVGLRFWRRGPSGDSSHVLPLGRPGASARQPPPCLFGTVGGDDLPHPHPRRTGHRKRSPTPSLFSTRHAPTRRTFRRLDAFYRQVLEPSRLKELAAPSKPKLPWPARVRHPYWGR